MSTLHETIHAALLAALAKHGESKYGVISKFDPIATESLITGIYKIRFVSEDVSRAVETYFAAAAKNLNEVTTP